MRQKLIELWFTLLLFICSSLCSSPVSLVSLISLFLILLFSFIKSLPTNVHIYWLFVDYFELLTHLLRSLTNRLKMAVKEHKSSYWCNLIELDLLKIRERSNGLKNSLIDFQILIALVFTQSFGSSVCVDLCMGQKYGWV